MLEGLDKTEERKGPESQVQMSGMESTSNKSLRAFGAVGYACVLYVCVSMCLSWR